MGFRVEGLGFSVVYARGLGFRVSETRLCVEADAGLVT